MATINGTLTGNDRLRGTAGNDIMNGYGGDDVFEGGKGADAMHGGTGNDSVDYSNAPRVGAAAPPSSPFFLNLNFNGVSVNLETGEGNLGDAAGDTYDSIENVYGSNYNDLLIGSKAANVIAGGNGDDSIIGGGGADTLSGGAGIDTVSYIDSTAAVKVSLTTNTASGGSAAGDIISGFENLVGSNHNDILSGSAGNNLIEGAAGNDSISGQGGDDVLKGGDGNDTLNGGSENDWLEGGWGSDKLTGGTGVDTFMFSQWDEGAGIDIVKDFQVGVDKIQFDILDPASADFHIEADQFNQTLTVQYLTLSGEAAAIVFEGVTSAAEANAIVDSFEFV